MARLKKRVAHGLDRAEASTRLRRFTDRARKQSDLDARWSEDHLAFSVTIQGLRLEGSVDVDDEAVNIDANIPMIAVPFSGWTTRVVQLALKQGAVPDTSVEARAPRTTAPGSPLSGPTILFLHVPKAGGSTMAEYIHLQCIDGGSGRSREPDDSEGELFKDGLYYCPFGFFKDPDELVPAFSHDVLARDDLKAVIGHFSFGIHEYVNRPSTYVTVLRDPVARVLSLYNFMQADQSYELEDFVSHPRFRELENDQVRRVSGLEPELGECSEATLEVAKKNLEQHFSVVGTTERFDETLILMKRAFGWQQDEVFYRKNVTPKSSSQSEIPVRVVDAIREINALDLELHEFASELMDQAIAAQGQSFHTELRDFEEWKRTRRSAGSS